MDNGAYSYKAVASKLLITDSLGKHDAKCSQLS